jgi:MGT family glycosyltransferase
MTLVQDADSAPDALPDGDGRLVYVSFGTVFNHADGVFATAVETVAALGLRTLVTVGANGDPDAFGTLPAHIRVERYVAQDHVLPHAALVVSHAGAGTMLGAAGSGIPQLCLPQGADQFDNAEGVARAGAGLVLHPNEATVEAVTEAVRRLLADANYTTNARRLQQQIAAMPSPSTIVNEIEQLVDHTAPR